MKKESIFEVKELFLFVQRVAPMDSLGVIWPSGSGIIRSEAIFIPPDTYEMESIGLSMRSLLRLEPLKVNWLYLLFWVLSLVCRLTMSMFLDYTYSKW